MKLKLITATALAALIGITLTPLPSNAEPVCVGSECTVTFDYSGSYEVFEIPTGAKDLRFDVQGARGGRFGGRGGQVTGSLGDLSGLLYIFVGGHGSEGSNVLGGFNGGGQSGGGHADEGSGGGASDIRTSLLLEDRIVVAGGGGGTGGWSGATGGAGGGLVGVAGAAGQGGAGEPGTQTNGGAPGFSNGGYVGTAGSFGQGGTGGFSSVSGGGGGGGGWFGGGGGGADVDTCCSDGGGGGGGSSYTSPLAQNVVHAQGVRSGNGVIVLSYSLPPEVTNFTLTQTGVSSAVAEIAFSTEIVSLEPTALSLTGATCDVEIIGAGASYQVALQECSSPQLTLDLLPNSVSNGANGPSVAHIAELWLDQVAPVISLGFEQWFSNTTTITLGGFVEGAVNELSEEAFSVRGCEGLELISATPLQLRLSECQQGEVIVELHQDSLWDEWGNSSPVDALTYSIWIDSIGPEPRFSLKESTQTAALIEVAGAYSDWTPVLGIDLGDTNCRVEFLNQFVLLDECAPGQISLALEAGSLYDEFGNSGPLQGQSFSHEFELEVPAEPEVLPEVIPEPESTPEPEATPDPEATNESPPVDRLEPPVVVSPPLVLDTPSVELPPLVDAPILDTPAAPEVAVEVKLPNPTELPGPNDEREEVRGMSNEALEPTPIVAVTVEEVVTNDATKSEASFDAPADVSLDDIQLVSGPALRGERPNWLMPLLLVALLAALIAGIVGYRFIGK